jgi:hypothetical protein
LLTYRVDIVRLKFVFIALTSYIILQAYFTGSEFINGWQIVTL